MIHFTFLQTEWPAVFDAAEKAEAGVHPDPRTACFYARRARELAVAWAYKHDSSLRLCPAYARRAALCLVRKELRKTLLKYQLHRDQELFEKAYGPHSAVLLKRSA